MKTFIVALPLFLAGPCFSSENSRKIDEFVSHLPKNQWGEGMYWLEMNSLVGWEKMMLVVGYAANGPVCLRLQSVARHDAPHREFRCTPAN